MNVFSDAAIVEIGLFASWLAEADVRGALIRSGKESGFCAGANLPEIWAAYDMVTATPKYRQFNAAYDHFFRLSLGLRALETCGKPVAAAVAGLALGGGGELALAAHYRVLTNDPRAAIGLPESLVGLLPGAGGTQRLPRLIGVEAAMPILLEGGRLSGEAALKAGLAHAVVDKGEEIAAAETWLLSSPSPTQSWDREDWVSSSPPAVSAALGPVRRVALEKSLGHYPALFAILDCVEFGLPQSFDGAIRSEMTSFTHLILRPEPRAMIQTLFLGRVDYERLERKGQLPESRRKSRRGGPRGSRSGEDGYRSACRGRLRRPPRRSVRAFASARTIRLLDRRRRSPRRTFAGDSQTNSCTPSRRSPRGARRRNCASRTTPRSVRPATPAISADLSRSPPEGGR